MACKRCKELPGAHGDRQVGQHHLFMSPARAKESIDTPEEFRVFAEHITPFKTKPWTWIVDCRGLTMAHYTNIFFVRNMANLLATEHDETLQEIWILNPTKLARAILALVTKTRLVSKVRLCKGDRLELLSQLKGPIPVVDWTIQVAGLPITEPLPPCA
jgi:hypothetical protein